MRIVHKDDVPENVARYKAPFDEEPLTEGRRVGDVAGTRGIGVNVDRLPPGRRTSRTHAHQREEELIYVLSGNPSVRLVYPGGGVETQQLRPGHFVSFIPGTGIAHSFHNATDRDVELLVLGDRAGGDRIHYPEDADLEEWRLLNKSNRIWSDSVEEGAKGTPYRIHTDRLVLRPWNPEEASELVDLANRNLDRLRVFMPWAEKEQTLDDMYPKVRTWRAQFDRDHEWFFQISLDGEAIGGIGLHPRVGPGGIEIGYWIGGDHEGKGLMSEAVAALTQAAMGPMGFVRVEIRMAPENTRSRAVPKRLGFHYEATLPKRVARGDGTAYDLEVWTMFKGDLAGTAAGKVAVKGYDGMGKRVL